MVEKLNNLTQILSNEEIIDLTLSYSKLSDFDRNGSISLVRNTFRDNDGVKFGSLVDDLLFQDNKYFKKTYYIFDGEKPTGTLGILCDIILKNYVQIPTKEIVLEIVKLNKLWASTKDEKLLTNNFDKDNFWQYLRCKFEVNDRVIITNLEYEEAIEIVDILKNHKYSRKVLFNKLDKYYQFKFEFEYKKFKVRGILDIINIDHENKKVYFIDLKTGKNPAIEFPDSFIKWRYYFQGAIYKLAFDSICKQLKLKDYTLEPFQFLYISKSDKIPLIYEMTDKWFNAAVKGFKINNYKFKGINELCDEIYWCWKNKEYDIPKYIVESDGKVEINDNFISVNE